MKKTTQKKTKGFFDNMLSSAVGSMLGIFMFFGAIFLLIMFYFPLFTVPLSLPFAYTGWISPSFNIWIVLFLVGICTQFGQTFLTFGYKSLPASKAAPVSYIQVPFSAIAGTIIFHANISYNFIIGSTIIFFAILLIIKNGNRPE